MKKLILLIVLNVISQNIITKAQSDKNTFDFWIGKWDAYWNDSLKGTNEISKILNNMVVSENFNTSDGLFSGKSWSVFDSASNIWKQAWVDNNGAYMLFTGGREGDNVVLNMTDAKLRNGDTYYMRMVFSEIKSESFIWDWQSSKDKTAWKSAWMIHYKRNNQK